MNRKEYLLSCLAEEFAESAQEVGKCLRFTPEHVRPNDTRSNFDRLVQEMADIEAIEFLLEEEGLKIDRASELYMDRFREKISRTVFFMGVSEDLGCLERGNENTSNVG